MKVFHYRTRGFLFAIGFLALWSTGWMLGTLSNIKHPKLMVNDAPATPGQAHFFALFALLIGMAVTAGTLWLLLYLINARVEIQFGKIRSYDFLGRRQVDAGLASVRIVGGRESVQKNVPVEISTDRGPIKVNSGLSHFQEFLDLIDSQRKSSTGTASSSVNASPFALEQKSYSYRGSYYLWFPIIFLTVGGPIVGLAFIRDGLTLAIGGFGVVLTIAFLSILILRAMNERIELGPDGLMWFDFRGRLKLSVPLQSIREIELESADETPDRCRVVTDRGVVTFDQYLRGYNQLVADLQRIQNDRPDSLKSRNQRSYGE